MQSFFKNIAFLSTFFCSIVIITLAHRYYLQHVHGQTDLIISRYQESLDYLNHRDYAHYKNIYIYNKGGILETKTLPKNAVLLTLPNVGCEVHSYLYHMINYRDKLARFNIFLQASFHTHESKNTSALTIFKHYYKYSGIFRGLLLDKTLYDEQRNFTLDSYVFTNNDNLNFKPVVQVTPSYVRPFGAWFQKRLPNNQTRICTFNGIFSITKERILAQPLELYQQFLDDVSISSHNEASHYIERCWAALLIAQKSQLTLIPTQSPYYSNLIAVY